MCVAADWFSQGSHSRPHNHHILLETITRGIELGVSHYLPTHLKSSSRALLTNDVVKMVPTDTETRQCVDGEQTKTLEVGDQDQTKSIQQNWKNDQYLHMYFWILLFQFACKWSSIVSSQKNIILFNIGPAISWRFVHGVHWKRLPKNPVHIVILGVTNRALNGSSCIFFCYYHVITVLAESPLAWIKNPQSKTELVPVKKMHLDARQDRDHLKVI